MFFNKELEVEVDTVLQADSVRKAQKIIQSKSGAVMLAAVSFMESSLPLPILTDPFFMAVVLVDRANVLKLIVIATVSSTLGGLVAYYTASFFLEPILNWMSPAIVDQFFNLLKTGDSGVFMLTVMGAVTPVPYTLVAWVVAVLKGNVMAFIIASLLGRGFRYCVVGYCTYYFGPAATKYIKKYIGLISIVLIIGVLGYFLL